LFSRVAFPWSVSKSARETEKALRSDDPGQETIPMLAPGGLGAWQSFFLDARTLTTRAPASFFPREEGRVFFSPITQYIGDTHNARTLIPMNTHANPPRSIFEDSAGKFSRLTKSPQTPRCRRERRQPLKAQTPSNPEKFVLTGSRTQDLRCYLDSCNR
jgi:hypothetical protein